MIAVPAQLARFTVQRLGAEGEAWLAALPKLVRSYADAWDLTLDGPPFANANVGLVLPVRLRDGIRAVLKLSIADDQSRAEGRGLAVWDGAGAVRLLRSDLDGVALLMERALPGTSLRALPSDRDATGLAGACLRELWRPVPARHGFATVVDEAPRWASDSRKRFERLGRPFARALLDRGMQALEELPGSTDEAVLLHQDPHQENFVAAERRPYLAIDPKPLVGERAFDCGSLLRDRRDDLEGDPDAGAIVARRLDQLAEDLDRERVIAWGVAQAMHLGLWALSVGLDVDGTRLIECGALIAALDA